MAIKNKLLNVAFLVLSSCGHSSEDGGSLSDKLEDSFSNSLDNSSSEIVYSTPTPSIDNLKVKGYDGEGNEMKVNVQVASTAYAKEYCVLATDDSPVESLGLADLLFYGERFSRAPYNPYSKGTRVETNKFKIGNLPDNVLREGYDKEFLRYVNDVCEENAGTFLDGRAKIIFTGPKFETQLEELVPFKAGDSFGLTKAGIILESEHKGNTYTAVYYDGWIIKN